MNLVCKQHDCGNNNLFLFCRIYDTRKIEVSSWWLIIVSWGRVMVHCGWLKLMVVLIGQTFQLWHCCWYRYVGMGWYRYVGMGWYRYVDMGWYRYRYVGMLKRNVAFVYSLNVNCCTQLLFTRFIIAVFVLRKFGNFVMTFMLLCTLKTIYQLSLSSNSSCFVKSKIPKVLWTIGIM